MVSPVKIGELAARTGLSVRTLHYYEEIGLLVPSQRGAGAHRLYDTNDLARLQRIVSLRALGLSLDEVRVCLDDPGVSPLTLLDRQLARVEEDMELHRQLRDRLQALAHILRAGAAPTVDDLMRAIEGITMQRKFFTPEQQSDITSRAAQIGDATTWREVIASARAEMARGSDPASEPVQRIAVRWRALVDAITGGDPEIEAALVRLYREDPSVEQWIDPELSTYMGRAMRRP
jgi:DNA-binding transcriptional MerR regulator